MQRAATRMNEAESSFRSLTAADRMVARPRGHQERALPRGGFAELARTSPLPTRAAKDVAHATSAASRPVPKGTKPMGIAAPDESNMYRRLPRKTST